MKKIYFQTDEKSKNNNFFSRIEKKLFSKKEPKAKILETADNILETGGKTINSVAQTGAKVVQAAGVEIEKSGENMKDISKTIKKGEAKKIFNINWKSTKNNVDGILKTGFEKIKSGVGEVKKTIDTTSQKIIESKKSPPHSSNIETSTLPLSFPKENPTQPQSIENSNLPTKTEKIESLTPLQPLEEKNENIQDHPIDLDSFLKQQAK